MHAGLDFEADLAGVPNEVRRALAADYARRRKSVLWAYVWWAVAGAHYAYLGQRREQATFALTLGGLGIWWAVDAVRIPRLVAAADAGVRAQLVARYRSFAPGLPMRPSGAARGNAGVQVARPAPGTAHAPAPGSTVPVAGRVRSS